MTILSPLRDSPRSVGGIARFQTISNQPAHKGFQAIACPDEEEGGYSIFAVHYPGVISQGESVEEARANIADAFRTMFDARAERGEMMEVSVKPIQEMTANCKRLWIQLDG